MLHGNREFGCILEKLALIRHLQIQLVKHHGQSFLTLLSWFERGKLKPHVSHRLDLAEAGRALALLAERKATGKVVLTTGR